MKAKQKPINPKLGQVYQAIRRYKVEHGGLSPSIRELCALTGVSSTSVLRYYLRQLQASGHISIAQDFSSRHISLPGEIYTPPAKVDVA